MSTKNDTKLKLSRRDFCRAAMAVTAFASAPLIVPSRLFGAGAPSKRIRVGQIGCGRIAQEHDMPNVLGTEMADIVALCDVDSKRMRDARNRVLRDQKEKGISYNVALYDDYNELLADPSIDAVVISTPDHGHAQQALAAVYAGKDIYLQKPMTMTVAEGKLLADAVAQSNCIFQLGSQQRSMVQFRQACELVRSGRVGRLQRIEIGLPIDPTAPDSPEQPVPKTLNYDRWLGPTPEVYYTQQRVHPQRGYGRPGWLRNDSYCLGMITGWGAHHFDIAHWAMNCELSGPSRIVGKGVFPKNKIWNVHGAYAVELTYPGNIIVNVSDKFPNGLKFIGDEGWIFVSRDSQPVTASDPSASAPPSKLKSLDASKPSLLDMHGLSVELPRSREHHENWLECVKSRRAPLVPAPVAHHGNTACVLSWIAMKCARPLQWDVAAERFINDDAANSMLSRPERAPYGAFRFAAAHKNAAAVKKSS